MIIRERDKEEREIMAREKPRPKTELKLPVFGVGVLRREKRHPVGGKKSN